MVMANPNPVSHSFAPRIGQTAPVFVRRMLLTSPDIVGIELRTFKPAKNIHARIAAGEDRIVALGSHDDDPLPPQRLSRERMRAGGLTRLIEHFLPEEHALAVSSCVQTIAGERHILVLDFVVPPSTKALDDIVSACKMNHWEGAVLMSGSSYHFIGTVPMKLEAWVSEMGRALLLTDVIDVRYMGHALARCAGSARITATEAKPTLPTVVALVGGGHAR